MKTRRSGIWVLAAVIAGLALVFIDARSVPEARMAPHPSAARPELPAASEPAATTAESNWDAPASRAFKEDAAVDVFAGKSWFVPPPKRGTAVKPVAPPKPTAPPIPYTFIGSYQDQSGSQVIFLARGDRMYSVTPGETLDDTYRVEGISSSQLRFIYLPLNIKQSMHIGEPS